MRRFDLMTEYSTLISPALAPRPWPYRPAERVSRQVRLPVAGNGERGRRFTLPAVASLVICIAAIAVL